MTQKLPIYVAIEGLVGSGKSTLCDALSNLKYKSLNVLREPVEAFQTYKNHNPLKLAYEDPKHNAAITQIHIIQSSHSHYSKALDTSDTEVSHIITERSMESPSVFIEANRFRGTHTEFVADYLYDYWDEYNTRVRSPDIIIYLNASPELCMTRIIARSREGEQHCDLTYLRYMKLAYENYLTDRVNKDGGKALHCIDITHETSVPECLAQVLKVIDHEGEKKRSCREKTN